MLHLYNLYTIMCILGSHVPLRHKLQSHVVFKLPFTTFSHNISNTNYSLAMGDIFQLPHVGWQFFASFSFERPCQAQSTPKGYGPRPPEFFTSGMLKVLVPAAIAFANIFVKIELNFRQISKIRYLCYLASFQQKTHNLPVPIAIAKPKLTFTSFPAEGFCC